MEEEKKATDQKKAPIKWLVVGAIIGIVILASLILILGPISRFLNPPRPEVTMVQGYDSLQGLNLVFIVDAAIKNNGGDGWVKVYAEISGYGKYEKQDQRIYLASGESKTVKFTFDVSLWGILGSPSITYRAWAVAD